MNFETRSNPRQIHELQNQHKSNTKSLFTHHIFEISKIVLAIHKKTISNNKILQTNEHTIELCPNNFHSVRIHYTNMYRQYHIFPPTVEMRQPHCKYRMDLNLWPCECKCVLYSFSFRSMVRLYRYRLGISAIRYACIQRIQCTSVCIYAKHLILRSNKLCKVSLGTKTRMVRKKKKYI